MPGKWITGGIRKISGATTIIGYTLSVQWQVRITYLHCTRGFAQTIIFIYCSLSHHHLLRPVDNPATEPSFEWYNGRAEPFGERLAIAQQAGLPVR